MPTSFLLGLNDYNRVIAEINSCIHEFVGQYILVYVIKSNCRTPHCQEHNFGHFQTRQLSLGIIGQGTIEISLFGIITFPVKKWGVLEFSNFIWASETKAEPAFLNRQLFDVIALGEHDGFTEFKVFLSDEEVVKRIREFLPGGDMTHPRVKKSFSRASRAVSKIWKMSRLIEEEPRLPGLLGFGPPVEDLAQPFLKRIAYGQSIIDENIGLMEKEGLEDLIPEKYRQSTVQAP